MADQGNEGNLVFGPYGVGDVDPGGQGLAGSVGEAGEGRRGHGAGFDALADLVPSSGSKVRDGEIDAGELGFVVVALGALGQQQGGAGSRLGWGREAAGKEED